MREIKFRGQRQSDNKWIYGDLLQPTEMCNIYEISDCESIDGSRYDVIKHTIGQYTGLKDKNGKEIYEGDIVRIDCPTMKMTGEIKYSEMSAMFYIYDEIEDIEETLWYQEKEYKVIGNVWEDSDLLNDSKNTETN